MKRKERYIARLDEVKITREGDYAFIEYKEEGVPATRLQIGPEIAGMSDEEIVGLHNERLRAQAKRAAEYKHVAVEVPLGLDGSSGYQPPTKHSARQERDQRAFAKKVGYKIVGPGLKSPPKQSRSAPNARRPCIGASPQGRRDPRHRTAPLAAGSARPGSPRGP